MNERASRGRGGGSSFPLRAYNVLSSIMIIGIPVALMIAHTIVHDEPFSPRRIAIAFAYGVLMYAAARLLQVPGKLSNRGVESIARVVIASLLAFFITIAIWALTGRQLLPRSVLLLTPILVSVYIVLLQVFIAVIDHARGLRLRIFALMPEHAVAEFGEDLGSGGFKEFELVGHATPRQLEVAAGSEAGSEAIHATITDANPDVLVLDNGVVDRPTSLEIIAQLHSEGYRVRMLTPFYEQALGRVPLSSINAVWFLYDVADLHDHSYKVLKRGVDIAASVIALMATAVLFPFFAAAIKLTSSGPVIFAQDRVGRGGNSFRLFKFRTMRDGAEEAEIAQWWRPGDERVTGFGRVLRASHLDELPQFWNVLRGEMSLVGPRPERPEIVGRLVNRVEHYDKRHLIQPGITGWAQVNLGYTSSVEGTRAKAELDFWYMKNQSFFVDLSVSFRTVSHLLHLDRLGRKTSGSDFGHEKPLDVAVAEVAADKLDGTA